MPESESKHTSACLENEVSFPCATLFICLKKGGKEEGEEGMKGGRRKEKMNECIYKEKEVKTNVSR